MRLIERHQFFLGILVATAVWAVIQIFLNHGVTLKLTFNAAKFANLSTGWWPFIAASVVLIAVAIFSWRRPESRTGAWDAISCAAQVVTAASAISIPLVIDQTSRSTRTLDQINDVARRIGDAVADKKKLDEKYEKPADSSRYEYSYIKGKPEVEAVVWKVLNEYEYLCLGANTGLLASSIIQGLRHDALKATFADYDSYIKEHRKSDPDRTSRAWIQCQNWLAAQR